jgi:3-dehydrosphinganine reductase
LNFEGANAIITGGSSGIGKATAKLLARRGANVFLIARDDAKLQQALQEIEAERANLHQQVGISSADVRDYQAVEAAVGAIAEASGGPHILITSAGITHPGYFEELPLSVFQEIIDTNYFGTLHAVKAVVPYMIAQRGGHIVTVSSVAGFMGVFGYTAYGASKFAVRGLSEALRSELKPYNIHVAVLIPPDTETPQLWEENKIKPRETELIAGTIKPMLPERVAQELLAGIERGKYLIMPGLETKLLHRLKGVSASLINWYTDRAVTKARSQRAEAEPTDARPPDPHGSPSET